MVKIKFDITITREQLVIPDESLRKVNERLALANVEQMRAKRDAQGAELPTGKRPPDVDLYETGRLQREVSADAEGYSFDAPYAQYVEDRYHFAGLPEDVVENLGAELGDLLDKEPLELVEGGEEI